MIFWLEHPCGQRSLCIHKVNAQIFTLLYAAAVNGFIFRKKIRLNFQRFDKENAHLQFTRKYVGAGGKN